MDGGTEKINSYDEYLDRYSFRDDRTVGIFEYTKRAIRGMDQVLSSLEFEIRDAETIYRFLTEEVQTVPFCDYLKRYICTHAELEESFDTISDAIYEDMIHNAFFENHMVFSFQPSKKRARAIIHGWLTRESAHRKTVFLLGFGLGMDDRDVTDFLTRVLKEEDFDFTDPTETVFWYCFHFHYPYARSQDLLKEAEDADSEGWTSEDYMKSVSVDPKICLLDENTLKEYLVYLKHHRTDGQEKAFDWFQKLYYGVWELCTQKRAGISYEIETEFCCGIPRDSNGNLRKISESSLADLFHHHKMSRQRMNMLLRRERPVNRFDLITFLFYTYSRKEGLPDQRRDLFIKEINEILSDCRMAELYFDNPYAMFVTLCLMTDDPLTTYGDVWEMSYADMQEGN